MIKSVRDFKVAGKRILVRCDFNVPLDGLGQIVEDFKIQAALPTIEHLVSQKAKVILMSHLGSPKGQVVEELKLTPVKDQLEKLLGTSVALTHDCVGKEVEDLVEDMEDGEVVLLENLRFHAGEEENAEEFAKDLAKLGDIFINDAFAECHRPYASIVGVPQHLPHGMGLLVEKEVGHLDKILKDPARPLVAIIGGAKVATKAAFVEKISHVADTVLLGGLIRGMADPDLDDATIKEFTKKILQAKTVFWNGPLGKCEEEKYQKGTRAVAKAIIKSKAFCVVGGGETVAFLRKEGILDKFSWVSTGGGAMLDYLADQDLPGIQVLE